MNKKARLRPARIAVGPRWNAASCNRNDSFITRCNCHYYARRDCRDIVSRPRFGESPRFLVRGWGIIRVPSVLHYRCVIRSFYVWRSCGNDALITWWVWLIVSVVQTQCSWLHCYWNVPKASNSTVIGRISWFANGVIFVAPIVLAFITAIRRHVPTPGG